MANMDEKASRRRMILCAGLQSGGTTLISWCFLQRQDTNGVLDVSHDIIQTSFEKVSETILWVKMTIGAFRWLDVYEIYCDLGWRPEPLLVVRDVRVAYSSLMKKDYGFSGTTAEQPPLRMRFRRFLRDWELFRSNGWSIIKYEDFMQDERAVLMKMCDAMALPWDEGMITWPKKLSEIAYVGDPNKTFAKSIGKGSLAAAKLRDKTQIRIDGLSKSELEWLEETFSAYNQFFDYPKKVQHSAIGKNSVSMAPASFIGTGRHWYYTEMDRLYRENETLIHENQTLRHENERLIKEKEVPR